jgi:hypothetical protein
MMGGHHAVLEVPFDEQRPADRQLCQVGFRAVGVIWQYGREGNGRFPDGLLTDLLRGELAGDR